MMVSSVVKLALAASLCIGSAQAAGGEPYRET